MRIAVDAMGGDNAPGAVVEGAVAAARDLGLSILLVGDRTRVAPELAKYKTHGLDIEARHAAEEIGMDEAPTAALRKADSSMAVALTGLRDGDADGMVYAGNTGAGMVLGAHVLGRVTGVERPAIAVQVPNVKGHTILLDAGANVDSRGTHLVQFALMGDAYARVIRHVAAPRIGLLSNGTEDTKGTAAVREAGPLLDQLPINYVGYVEGADIVRGEVDVVVCDGFVGNVVLKTMEGFGSLVGSRLRDMLQQGVLRRLAGLILRRHLGKLARDLDPGETGGALLLGLNGTVVKAHGSSDARAIRNAIGVASDLAQARVSQEVGRSIAACLEIVAAGVNLPTDDGPEPGRARRLWNSVRKRLRRDRTGETEEDVALVAAANEAGPVAPAEVDPPTIEEGTMDAPASEPEPTTEGDPKVKT
ncbi:MAG: phosphate acyltransferase PlsX [Candidatus Binatia bacterium]|nr:phosphate acyltransferase PlsX [Candidatus Binatia bacterium]